MQETVTNKIEKELEKVGEVISESSLWEKFVELLNYPLYTFTNENDTVTGILKIKYIILVIAVLMLTTFVLRWLKKLLTSHMPIEDRAKFTTVFSFARWLIYIIVFLVVLSSLGINVTAIFAASAALLIGVGLALQTLFQDIISGIFILVDQSVHVGDIIEIEGKVGRVEEIKLRTTRAVTIDNKVLVIPNHLYLTNSLYNWTQNGSSTRETIDVGVAYGSDVRLVEKLLIKAAKSSSLVFKQPEPRVIFTDFGESSLNFRVAFTIEDSFNARFPKSEIRFAIDKLFRENNISIPFPQRDVHVIQKENQDIQLKMSSKQS
ncbi:mechanosensitive ion channel domain-containing protein [Lacinutrix sp.]|uniref:mechanosensitive ion channel family protein n=1 Tax=Lacinutrix sp. TaxID=1937692 RepID=UPI00261F5F89|nr:mechanosensitive ion channel domain-containing protein [Lacinutrix sp.]MDG1714198.1 mechanosensitive ion channel [Lacinutrix sp.]